MFHDFHGSLWELPQLPWKLAETSEACRSFHGSFNDFRGSCWKLPRLPWKFVGPFESFRGRGSLYKLPTKHSALFTPPLEQETGLQASYTIDCESCKWLISTDSASTESTKLGLTSGHDFVASGVNLPAVCPYPCWCRIGDELLMRPGPPVQE